VKKSERIEKENALYSPSLSTVPANEEPKPILATPVNKARRRPLFDQSEQRPKAIYEDIDGIGVTSILDAP
jgi:hypothetical protein